MDKTDKMKRFIKFSEQMLNLMQDELEGFGDSIDEYEEELLPYESTLLKSLLSRYIDRIAYYTKKDKNEIKLELQDLRNHLDAISVRY